MAYAKQTITKKRTRTKSNGKSRGTKKVRLQQK